MLKVDNISKKYGNKTIFSNISFEIKKGEVLGVTGKSGCGKSTLLKCLNKLEPINYGKILLNDININDFEVEKLRQKIGIVFQEFGLFTHMNVLDNLTLGLIKIKKISKKTANKEALKILKKLDLEEKKFEYPSELSGGEKQRVALARTIILDPDIIMLDEPTSALDKYTKKKVLNIINELVKKNKTLIIVSHEDEIIEKVSDKIISFRSDNIVFKENKCKGDL